MANLAAIKLVGPSQRAYAGEFLRGVGAGVMVIFKEPTRTDDQNAKMWAMLADIRRAKPMGRDMIADDWKAVFMRALGHEIRFIPDINGEMFPLGYRSSHMTVKQMSALIEYMHWFCAEHEVPLIETERRALA